jgi:hypothetical protein
MLNQTILSRYGEGSSSEEVREVYLKSQPMGSELQERVCKFLPIDMISEFASEDVVQCLRRGDLGRGEKTRERRAHE